MLPHTPTGPSAAPLPPVPGDARALDLCGLKCPLPVLRTRKALSEAAPGQRFVIRCTDPMAAIDIPHLLKETGDHLDALVRGDGVLTFHVRKQATSGTSPA